MSGRVAYIGRPRDRLLRGLQAHTTLAWSAAVADVAGEQPQPQALDMGRCDRRQSAGHENFCAQKLVL